MRNISSKQIYIMDKYIALDLSVTNIPKQLTWIWVSLIIDYKRKDGMNGIANDQLVCDSIFCLNCKWDFLDIFSLFLNIRDG